jgi:GDSL-like lipase/acylhydrolase family protein
MPDAPRPCDTHPDLVAFKYPLPHLTHSLRHLRRTGIVAIGSSSTAGADGILAYPCRLEMMLRQRFFGRMIDVLNRGIGGQEAPEELSRFESDVIGEAPSLVIWQVGTNAVFHNYNPEEVAAAIAAGLDWLAGLAMDVVLMDLQYTRAITGSDKLGSSEDMVSRISAAADKASVNVFRRFALMRRWYRDGIPIEELDDGGQLQLHTSEWATGCVTQALFGSIVGAPQATA